MKEPRGHYLPLFRGPSAGSNKTFYCHSPVVWSPHGGTTIRVTTEVIIDSECFCWVLSIVHANVHVTYVLHYPLPPDIPMYFL